MLDGSVKQNYKEFIEYLNNSDMSQEETDVVRSYVDAIMEDYEREIKKLMGEK
ncbi:hypothetical protein RKD55_004669 [Rossellomorea marisflavi]